MHCASLPPLIITPDKGKAVKLEESLKVKKIDKLSSTQIRLTVEFPQEAVSEQEKRTTQSYSQAARIPGFRPGKAPLTMVKSKFGDQIQKDVVSKLLEAGMVEAFRREDFHPVSRPQITFDHEAIGKGNGFEFKAEFEIQPEIELKHYKNVPLKAADFKIADEEVDTTLNSLRERFSVLEPTEQTKPEKGIFGVVEVGFTVKETGKVEEPKPFTVELGEQKLIDELEKGFMEMSVGEQRDIEAKFPDDFDREDLRGKDATFKCKILELKKKVLPELDDALASQIKPEATLESLKQDIRDSLFDSKKEEYRKNQRQEIIDYLIKQHSFDVPKSLVQRQSESLMQWMFSDMQRRGTQPPATFENEQMEEITKRAERMVRSSLLLREVAVREKITLDEQRVQEKVASVATQIHKTPEEALKLLSEKGNLDELRDEVLTDQVFDFIVENAQFVDNSPR